MKRLLLLPLVLLGLGLGGCKEAPAIPPPRPTADMVPVGDGLKVLGFAFLGAAVVVTLGRFVR